MKAFTGFAIGILAVLGAVAAVFIYLKKKTEKEIEYDEFDEIMDSDADFDDDFFDDDDEVIDINSALKDLGNEFINNTLPVAGKYVANTLRGYGSTTFIPFADSISNLISTVAKLYNPPRGRDRSDVVLSGLYNIGLDVSSSIGVPSELIRRIVKMFINTKDWEFSFNPLYFINTNAGNWLEDKIH